MIFLTKQEYQHIRNLAWDLLIDANITSLPVSLHAIAALYGMQSLIDTSKSRYENACILSYHILKIFGYKNELEYVRYLAIRILAPMIVLREVNVSSAKEVADLTELPIQIASQRYRRYCMLLDRNAFGTSQAEVKVLSQFMDWIITFRKTPR